MKSKMIPRKLILLSLFLLGVITVLDSCHSSQKIMKINRATPLFGDKVKDKEVIRLMEERWMDYKTLSARLKIDFKSKSINQKGLTSYLKMKKDSIIWISVRPVLGIEMGRFEFTQDSVKILNSLKKYLYLNDIAHAATDLSVPLSFALVQDLILGNTPFNKRMGTEISSDSSDIIVRYSDGEINYTDTWSKHDFLLEKSAFELAESHQKASQSLENYGIQDERLFSYKRKIEMGANMPVSIEIEMDKVTFDAPVSVPSIDERKYRQLDRLDFGQ